MTFSRLLLISSLCTMLPAAVFAQELSMPGAQQKKDTPATAPQTEAPPSLPEFDPPAAPPAASVQGEEHVVQRGDTLWDLAGTYYKDPFSWRRIWEANRATIQNPDLIYPDQTFVVPGIGTVTLRRAPARVTAPVEEEETSEEAAPEETVAAAQEEDSEVSEETPAEVLEPIAQTSMKAGKLYTYEKGTYVASEDWVGDGQIVGDLNKKVMISQQDVVYLNIGASSGIVPRMRAQVYRKGRKVREPSTGKTIGVVVRRVGVLEITKEVGDETSSAIVITSYEPMQVGDAVKLGK